MAVIAGIGTREYYRSSGYELEDSYMVKDLTVSGLHAGRPDLLADQPKHLLIEYQDLQKAASQLLLPLPPKAPLSKRRNAQGNRRGGKGKGRIGAQDTEADGTIVASIEETREKARFFLSEYTVNVESIDVPKLLQRLQNSENTQQNPVGPASAFTDRDTFAEHCSMYASLQKSLNPSTSTRSALTSLQLRMASWLLGDKRNASGAGFSLVAAAGATVAVVGVATGLLWFAARRRQ